MARGKSKRAKLAILDALTEKAPLSTNKGVFDRSQRRRPTPKQRRHRGWRTPRIVHPRMKYSGMVENALEPGLEYDEWESFKDGMRDTKDRTKIIPRRTKHYGWWGYSKDDIEERNKKLKREVKIKEAMRKSKK